MTVPYRDPFEVHEENATRLREEAARSPSPNLNGDEIACVVGGYGEASIPALFDPSTRTVFPVRK
jgi:uncharacterized protein involved in type VI secretion and phage assembly